MHLGKPHRGNDIDQRCDFEERYLATNLLMYCSYV